MSRVFKKKKLIVICGPTASGKTELAIKLALRLSPGQAKKKFGIRGIEIISADSRQIYRGMDIGTAKPAPNVKCKMKKEKCYLVEDIPHYLIDIVNPDEEFSLAEYQKLANEKISEIHSKEKIPFLVGGTGLYINAVVYGYQIPKGKPDINLRKRLEKESNEKLLQKLKKLDPNSAKNIDQKNKRRLVRALEVCILTGKPFSDQRIKRSTPYDILILGIDTPKNKLNKKIEQRVEKMLKQGLIPEVNLLLKKGYSENLPAMSGIGYKEIVDFLNQTKKLNNKITKEQLLKETIDLIKKNTRKYSKRQLTWFKRDKNIHWIKNFNQAENLINKFLNN